MKNFPKFQNFEFKKFAKILNLRDLQTILCWENFDFEKFFNIFVYKKCTQKFLYKK